jgi:hypothetical protein
MMVVNVVACTALAWPVTVCTDLPAGEADMPAKTTASATAFNREEALLSIHSLHFPCVAALRLCDFVIRQISLLCLPHSPEVANARPLRVLIRLGKARAAPLVGVGLTNAAEDCSEW